MKASKGPVDTCKSFQVLSQTTQIVGLLSKQASVFLKHMPRYMTAHARKQSDHEECLQKTSIKYIELQKSSHFNSTVNSICPSHLHNHKTFHVCSSRHKKLHYLTRTPLSLIERGVHWHLTAEALAPSVVKHSHPLIQRQGSIPAGGSTSGSALSCPLFRLTRWGKRLQPFEKGGQAMSF